MSVVIDLHCKGDCRGSVLSLLGKTFKLYLPILVRVRPSLTDDKENHFTLMIILEQDANTNLPPESTAEGVFIYHQKEQIFYVKRFSGFAKEADWKRESTQLLEICKTFPVNQEEVISASYDMPTKLLNRHNEVLIAELNETATES